MSDSYSKSVSEILSAQVEALRALDDAAYRNHVHEMNGLAIDMAMRIDSTLEAFAKLR